MKPSIPLLEPAHLFLDECKKYDSPERLGSFLQARYRALFHEEAPLVRLCLIQAKIASELQFRALKSSGATLTARFMKNYAAYQALNPEALHEDSKFFMRVSFKTEDQKGAENAMATVQKKAATPAKPVSKKGAVTVAWISLLAKKLPPDQVASEMRKSFPLKKKYTVEDVAKVASLFNHGKLKGQLSVPSSPYVFPKKK